MEKRFDDMLPARMRFYQPLFDLSKHGGRPILSVSGLCTRVSVSRTTFYRYFKDIDDYYVQFFGDVLIDTTAGMQGNLDFFHAIELQCKRTEQSDLLKSLAPSVVSGELLAAGSKRTKTHMTELVRKLAPDQLDNDVLFQIEAVSYGLPTLLQKWAASDFEMTPTEFARSATNVMPERLLGIVGDRYL